MPLPNVRNMQHCSLIPSFMRKSQSASRRSKRWTLRSLGRYIEERLFRGRQASLPERASWSTASGEALETRHCQTSISGPTLQSRILHSLQGMRFATKRTLLELKSCHQSLVSDSYDRVS